MDWFVEVSLGPNVWPLILAEVSDVLMVSSVTLWSMKHRKTQTLNCSTVQETIRHGWIFAIDKEWEGRGKKRKKEIDFFFSCKELNHFYYIWSTLHYLCILRWFANMWSKLYITVLCMFELWKFIKVFCIVLHISMRHLLSKQYTVGSLVIMIIYCSFLC